MARRINPGRMLLFFLFISLISFLVILLLLLLLLLNKKKHQHAMGVSEAWVWLVRLTKQRPVPFVTATALEKFLRVAGPRLAQSYGVQFTKMMQMIAGSQLANPRSFGADSAQLVDATTDGYLGEILCDNQEEEERRRRRKERNEQREIRECEKHRI